MSQHQKPIAKNHPTNRELDLQWPTPFKSSERSPEPTTLVVAWKPLINGWDIVLGREVAAAPAQYTHWLPIPPAPD
jgi:hypothetical protein